MYLIIHYDTATYYCPDYFNQAFKQVGKSHLKTNLYPWWFCFSLQELENCQNAIEKHGIRIGDMENKLKILEKEREVVKQELCDLQGWVIF